MKIGDVVEITIGHNSVVFGPITEFALDGKVVISHPFYGAVRDFKENVRPYKK